MKKVICVVFFLAFISQMCLAKGVEKSMLQTSFPDTINIDELVVTGSRIPAKRGNTAQRLDVITIEQLEVRPLKDLTSLVKTATSINIIDYGGMLSGLSLRGFRPEFDNLSGRSTILIDGRPAASSNLALLDISNAERVEVLRGPASSIYGPTAMGGVVNIITKKSRGSLSGKLEASIGSFGFNSQRGSVGGAIPKSRMDFDISANRVHCDNYKAGEGGLFRKWLGGDEAQFTYTSIEDGLVKNKVEMQSDKRGDGVKMENSGYTRTSYTARLGYQLTSSWRANVYYENNFAGDVGSPADIMKVNLPFKKDLSRDAVDFTVDGRLGDVLIFTRGYYGNQQSDSYNLYDWEGNRLPQDYISYRSKFDWKGVQVNASINLKYVQITVGSDYGLSSSFSHKFDEKGDELDPYSLNYTLGTAGFYQQTKIALFNDRLIGTLGLRYDLNKYETKTSSFDNAKQGTSKQNDFFTPSFGLKYKLNSNLHLNTTYGKGFSYANPFHLTGYWEKVSSQNPNEVSIDAGNPNLNNQESDTWDFGFSYTKSKSGIAFEATYFNTILKNSSVPAAFNQSSITSELLDKYDVPYVKNGEELQTLEGKKISGFSSYENAYKSRIQGVEMSLSYDFGALADFRYSLQLYASYVHLIKMEEEFSNAIGLLDEKNIFNVAKQTLNFGINYDDQGIFSAGLSGRFVGYRYDYDWTDWMNPSVVRYPKMMTLDLFVNAIISKSMSCVFYVSNLTDENYYEKRDYNLAGRNFSLKVVYSF